MCNRHHAHNKDTYYTADCTFARPLLIPLVLRQLTSGRDLAMSFTQVMAHSGGGLAADRTPFFGIKTPPEVKKLVQLSKSLDQGTFRKILRSTER